MSGGGTDCESDLAVARLRMRLEQEIGPAATARLRREEGREVFEARLAVLALVGIVYVLLDVLY
jgi:hypothetical protein